MRMKVCVCRFCGKVFRHHSKISSCEDCRHLEDEQFEAIRAYLDKYPNSNAMQIAEGLEIPTMDILRFIDEGRLVVNRGTFKSI